MSEWLTHPDICGSCLAGYGDHHACDWPGYCDCEQHAPGGNNRIPGKRRMIRKVTKFSKKDGRPKRVRDRNSLSEVERVTARVQHRCDKRDCKRGQGLYRTIHEGEEYLRVATPASWRPRLNYPLASSYHVECLPEHLLPCLRFFGVKS